jgi:phage-related holin
MATTQDLIGSATCSIGRLLEAADVKLAIGGVVGLASSSFSWAMTPGLVQSAVLLLFLDWITGTLKAVVARRVNSDAGVRGIVKSFLYLGVLLIALNLSGASGLLFGWLDDVVAVMLITTELVSVLENLDELATQYQIDAPMIRVVLDVARRYLKRKVDDATRATENEAQASDPQAKGENHDG